MVGYHLDGAVVAADVVILICARIESDTAWLIVTTAGFALVGFGCTIEVQVVHAQAEIMNETAHILYRRHAVSWYGDWRCGR